jgi:hypothetical protein
VLKPKCWIVDLVNERLHRHRNPRADTYVDRSLVSFGETSIPGLDIEVDLTAFV